MKLDYGTLLSPAPIKLSIGTLRKPTLLDIAELTFDKYGLYEAYTKLTPEKFFLNLLGEEGKTLWKTLSEDQRSELSLFDLVLNINAVRNTYVELFDYFFVENVAFKENAFLILNKEIDSNKPIPQDAIIGVITKEIFQQVLSLIQQICCIYEEKAAIENMKFKNSIARKMYEKMLKAQEKEKETKKSDINHSLPNIISAVSNSHPTINPVNVWNLTTFQLFDAFNRLQLNKMYDINARRVSVWGDEKKTFDVSLWYKNEYDKR